MKQDMVIIMGASDSQEKQIGYTTPTRHGLNHSLVYTNYASWYKFIQHSEFAHPCLSADTEGKDEHLNGTLTPSEKLTVVYILTWVWLHDFIHNKVCGATHCRSAHAAFLVLPRFSKVLKLRLSQCYLLANIFLKTSYISR